MKPWARNHKCLLLILELPAFGAALLFVALPAVASTVSYDSDDDGLIEVSSLAQLNAIRWDLDGDGVVDNGANRVAYTSAFPDAAAGMGCALADHDGHSATPDVPVCTGYELAADLDFDTDGDGAVDAADEYWHSGAGWKPIGSSGTANEFIATFEGNGHTITRMFIDRSSARIGLFGVVGNGGRVRNVGVREVSVTGSSQGNIVGGLAGKNAGSITASYVTGSVASTGGTSEVGGLVGRNGGPSDSGSSIVSSYAAVSVTGPGRSRVGGLAGYNYGRIRASYASGAVTGTGNQPYVGGLVGLHNGGSIAASYATGWVTGSGSVVGGLVGRNDGGISSDSYWDTATSGQVTSPGGVGKTTAELQTPTGYTGIYASWNLDLDNSDGDGDATTGGDDPWDFGTASDYPVVRLDFDGDGRATWQEFGEQRPDASTPPDTGSSDDATLKALAVSPVDMAGFSADVLSHQIGVANEVSQVTVTPYLNNEAATIDIDGSAVSSGSGHAVPLAEGRNVITITVTAQDGTTTREYTVTADRGSNAAFGWKVIDDFNELRAENSNPTGIWSNGTNTMWVADESESIYSSSEDSDEIYSYHLRTKQPLSRFGTIVSDPGAISRGIWSNGVTMWVTTSWINDRGFHIDSKIYAYRMSTYARDPAKDFNTLNAAGNTNQSSLWSDGTTMWVADFRDDKIYAYSLSSKARDTAKDFNTLNAAGNRIPMGIWSDGNTMWVAGPGYSKLYAYDRDSKARVPLKDFNTLIAAGNTEPWGIWSDGTTMWVVDSRKKKIFSYNMPSRADATLRELSVIPTDITGFSRDVTAYHVGVDNDVTQLWVMPTLNLSGGTIDLDGNSVVSGSAHAISLSDGRNDVTITVTADDGRTTKDYTVTVGRSVITDYGWNAAKDFNTLNAADNDYPTGIWSDGTTMWVADSQDDKLYAYNLSTSAREEAKDITSLDTAGNTSPDGIWSDGTTMWVADPTDDKLYAYNLSTAARDDTGDFNTLGAAGNQYPTGIWSDRTTMWVLDTQDDKIYAYNLATKARDATKDFNTLSTLSGGNRTLSGIWSDGTTMWVVVDRAVHGTLDDKIYAYDLATKARDETKDFNGLTSAGNEEPSGVWSDGTTLWVANYELRSFNNAGDRIRYYSSKIYAYNMPSSGGSTTAATDFNGDGRTDFVDFFLFADAYGGTDSRFDLDGNGTVDFADFFKFVDAFGS